MSQHSNSYQVQPKATPVTTSGAKVPNAISSLSSAGNEALALDDKVESIRRAFVDELCALRRDVDSLQNGAWRVEFGPFRPGAKGSSGNHVQVHQAANKGDESKIVTSASEPLKTKRSDSFHDGDKTPTIAAVSGVPASAPLAVKQPWKPAHINSLKPLAGVTFPSSTAMVTFTWDFLTKIFLGATEHSPGLFYLPQSAGGSLLPNRTFYAIDAKHEPFLPIKPCDHGAKMTAFFNPDSPTDGDEPAYEDVPLFVAKKTGEYIYMGTYSQSRWSDKLSHDVIAEHVPASVKEYWATQLTDPARPGWVTKCLMKQFFPMPEYEGPIPKSTPNGSAVTEEDDGKAARKTQRAVKHYIEELRLWEVEARNMVGLMKKEDILKAFEKADADENPGLRLWWEYLECKKWDKGFYDMLVREQNKLHGRR